MPFSMSQINGFRCFEGSFIFSTSSTGVSDYIIVPYDSDRVSVQLAVLSTASVSIEATVSTQAEVEAGTARWKEWDNGAITGGAISQDSTKGPISALRINVKTALAGNNAFVSVRSQRGNP
jgi:hypothetical protein